MKNKLIGKQKYNEGSIFLCFFSQGGSYRKKENKTKTEIKKLKRKIIYLGIYFSADKKLV